MKHKMVKTFQAYLPEKCHRLYSCVHCRAHLANHDELISKVRIFIIMGVSVQDFFEIRILRLTFNRMSVSKR